MRTRILIYILITAVLFSAGCTETASESTNAAPVESPKQDNITEAPQSTDVCYFDWQYSTTPSLGEYYTAPPGYNYAVVKIYIKNNADQTVSTNPFYWDLVADGIKYSADSATFSESINAQSVDIGKGGEMETTIIYVVKGNPADATLTYSGFASPKMEETAHY